MGDNVQKKSIKYFLFILTIYMLTFQNIIQRYIPIFKYFDELLALSVIPILIIKLKKTQDFKIKKNHLIIVILLFVIVMVGLYANITFKYQPIKFVLSDMVIVLKFFMAYFLSNMMLSKNFINDNKHKIYKHICLIIYFLFVCTILNYVYKIWPSVGARFGIMSNQLFYEHPTYLAATSVFLLALLELTRENTRKEVIPIICISIVLMTTLRLKAVGAICVAIMIMIYTHKTKKKITLIKILILAFIAILVAHEQIFYYFFEIDQSARRQLLEKSIQIVKDFFPIGTGFATFGSYFSAVSYSPVYYMYNLTKIQGLSPDSPAFIADTFWPAILGQFGFIGIICYIGCIILIFKNIQEIFSKSNVNIYVSKLICLVYLMISSTSETAFMHTMAIPLALIIGINAFNTKEDDQDNTMIDIKKDKLIKKAGRENYEDRNNNYF